MRSQDSGCAGSLDGDQLEVTRAVTRFGVNVALSVARSYGGISASSRAKANSFRRPDVMARPIHLLFVLALSACSGSEQPSASPADAGLDAVVSSDAGPDGALDAPSDAATAWESNVACDYPGVRSVDAPATADPNGPRIRFRYRAFEASPTAPWVFVVPGGPGQSLIAEDASSNFALGAVPTAQFNIVYVDARGSGCNVFPDLGTLPDEDAYTIQRVASDVRAVIERESPDEYYLYGASFGTAVVTVAAHDLAQSAVPLPKSIVLEGVLGRAFASFDEYFAAFKSEWARVQLLIPSSWRQSLTAEPFADPNGYTRYQWGAFVSQQLILGDYPGYGHLLSYWLNGLTANDAAANAYVQNFMSSVPAGIPSQPSGGLFSTIACRELWGHWLPGRELSGAELNAVGADLCSGMPRNDYDSVDYLSTIPAVYFHGPFDPTTTTAQAQYHFDNHHGSVRDFITVPNTAHTPLTLGLAARGCAPQVWQAIRGQQQLATVVASCAQSGETIDLVHRDD